MTDRRRTGERRNHLMSDKDVAKEVGVSTNTVRYWRQTGVLPFVRVGRTPRVWYSEFLRVFQKPLPPSGGAGTMPLAGSIRRQT
jgi:excisionase family DNA binding protein